MLFLRFGWNNVKIRRDGPHWQFLGNNWRYLRNHNIPLLLPDSVKHFSTHANLFYTSAFTHSSSRNVEVTWECAYVRQNWPQGGWMDESFWSIARTRYDEFPQGTFRTRIKILDVWSLLLAKKFPHVSISNRKMGWQDSDCSLLKDLDPRQGNPNQIGRSS